jgi:hypothetical protein
MVMNSFDKPTLEEAIRLNEDGITEKKVTSVLFKDMETSTPGGEVPQENGGPKGPEPTRFGDWERKGRCSDF